MEENKNQITIPDLSFLTAVHDKHLHIDKMHESRGQILLVTAGLIATFALNQVVGKSFSNYGLREYGWLIISLSSLVSIFLSISAIRPKVFVKGKETNLFYYGDFLKKLSQAEYSQELTKILGDRKKMIDAFSEEIYALSENVLVPGLKRLNLAYRIFGAGLILGLLILMAASLIS